MGINHPQPLLEKEGSFLSPSYFLLFVAKSIAFFLLRFHDIASAASHEPTLLKFSEQKPISFCVRGLLWLWCRRQALEGLTSIEDAHAETKPPGWREKASLKVKSYELRVEPAIKTETKSPPLI